MKLIRFGAPARERPGVILPDGRRIDASGFAGESADYDEAFFASDGLERLAQWVVQEGRGAPVVPDGVRLGPPLSRPSKIVCVGLNYRDHARESGMAVPDETVLFFKATSAITGPNDDVIIPKNGTKVDWEVELAVVIGRRAAYVERDKAGEHIAGYLLHNDYSERSFQLERGGQWVKGQELRQLRAAGTVSRHAGRDSGRARPPDVAQGERRNEAMQLDPRAHLRRTDARQLHQPVHDALARGHHLHRYTRGRGIGPEPATLPGRRRRGRAWHRRARLGAPAVACLPLTCSLRRRRPS